MKKRNWLKIGSYALAGGVLCGALVYYNFVYEDESNTAATIGSVCPDFELNQIFGKENGAFVIDETASFKISEKQGKVVVLNFWATYCDPCREEIPHFNEFYEDYKDKGVEVVIINGETYMPPQSLLDGYLNNASHTHYEQDYSKWAEFSCTFGRYDKDNNILSLFDIGEALPITIIVDKEGVVSYMGQTKLSYQDLEGLVNPLLAE